MKPAVTFAAILAAVTMMLPPAAVSAASLEGGCTCTDIRGVTCDPNRRLDVATYFIDQNGEVWHCEKDECTPTGVFV